jgi:D-aspartate ligase
MEILVHSGTAVVLADGATGLGAIWGLHDAGVPTIAVVSSPNEPAMHSRLPKQKLLVRSSSPDKRDHDLLALLQKIEDVRPVLIPTSDRHVSFMAANRRSLTERFDFCLPNDDLVERLNDKVKEIELIRSHAFALPQTVENLPSCSREMAEQLGFPIIIKPRSSEHFKFLGKKNLIIRTQYEMDSFYDKYSGVFWALIAQEVIPGPDESVWHCICTFSRSHELMSAFTFKKLRMIPAHFGVPTYAISERNQEVVGLVSELGKELRYTGPASVEFKFDVRDGQYKYIEINPRLGMCHYYGAVCGVNNVLYTYMLARGISPEKRLFQQREGVLYLSLAADLYSYYKDGGKILPILYQYAKIFRRQRVGAYLKWTDLGPALAYAAGITVRTAKGLGENRFI